MRRRVQLGVGFVVYAIAFLLPAVKMAGDPSGPIVGWTCAVWSLVLPFQAVRNGAPGQEGVFCLLGLSGLVNPLILVYLGLWAWSTFVRIRWGLCAAVAAGAVSSWVYFVLQHFVPVVGHFLWIAGMGIMLTTEIGRPNNLVRN